MATFPLTTEVFRSAHACFPRLSPGAIKLKAEYCANALSNPDQTRELLFPAPGSTLARLISQRPEVRGVLVWPFQCSAWSLRQRLERFIEHYRMTGQLDDKYQFGADQQLKLLDLSEQSPGACMILDQPIWFMREGGFTLNLFLEDFRAFSIAFALYEPSPGQRAIYVGGLQGRNREDALETYRALTKAFHGLRPRDLMIENLRLLARSWGVTQITCVGDARRHHFHPFFKDKTGFSNNYDTAWEDRGGVRAPDGDFDLPLMQPKKSLESIAAKKRSQYRKRYAFLDQIDAIASAQYPDAALVDIKAT